MSMIGVKIEQFDVPVCNSFIAKTLNDQLCYTIDLDKYIDANNIGNVLEEGFNFFMDYNEDRQVTIRKKFNKKKVSGGLASSFVEEEDHATIYLNSIGEWVFSY